MYKIKVLHDYIYKLVAELRYQLPDAQYRVRGDTLITHDAKIVEIAKYVFQFQPGLLVVENSAPVPRINIDMKRENIGRTLVGQNALKVEVEVV